VAEAVQADVAALKVEFLAEDAVGRLGLKVVNKLKVGAHGFAVQLAMGRLSGVDAARLWM
jgi:hypothetical protein